MVPSELNTRGVFKRANIGLPNTYHIMKLRLQVKAKRQAGQWFDGPDKTGSNGVGDEDLDVKPSENESVGKRGAPQLDVQDELVLEQPPDLDKGSQEASPDLEGQTRDVPPDPEEGTQEALPDPEEETREAPLDPRQETRKVPLDCKEETRESLSDPDEETREAPSNPEKETQEAASDSEEETKYVAGLAVG